MKTKIETYYLLSANPCHFAAPKNICCSIVCCSEWCKIILFGFILYGIHWYEYLLYNLLNVVLDNQQIIYLLSQVKLKETSHRVHPLFA